MSKSSVPEVYARVIKEVCEASRQDFEESGVDLAALELLQQGWQKRLSAEHIATFPWDPKPEPIKTELPPIHSNAKAVLTVPSNGSALSPPSSSSTPGPQIKQEHQQYATQPPPQLNYATQYPQGPTMSAEQRASMHLQQRYGQQAAAQIAQLQNQQRVPAQPTMHQQPQPQQQPYIKQEFKHEDSHDHSYPQQTYNTSVPIKNSQVDGAADAQNEYRSEIARRRALVAQHREAGDRLIRDQVLSSQQSLEGGGLMMPLNAHRPIKHRHIQAEPATDSSSLARNQGDAAGDEDDEDAINSDLDDPDELDEANADEENVTNVMLCTYDKVQRVKNKWKCTLKDGVLKVDGSEFVFHKGQGEFEW
ncbi:hypothetical protein LTR05_001580 [Lithohypha guttulata]|uniref:Uncharacterized protein n=1 Tax=Lithohypha guttulata TaxID=1690604 RepID=A0AAN7YFB4_9EURO|nr:hypothetical protein LTR05_001580 [Lithohypha guttulata]